MSFGFDLGCLDAEFGMDIQDPQRMNPNSFGDSLTLHLAAGAGQNVCLSRITAFSFSFGSILFYNQRIDKTFWCGAFTDKKTKCAVDWKTTTPESLGGVLMKASGRNASAALCFGETNTLQFFVLEEEHLTGIQWRRCASLSSYD